MPGWWVSGWVTSAGPSFSISTPCGSGAREGGQGDLGLRCLGAGGVKGMRGGRLARMCACTALLSAGPFWELHIHGRWALEGWSACWCAHLVVSSGAAVPDPPVCGCVWLWVAVG